MYIIIYPFSLFTSGNEGKGEGGGKCNLGVVRKNLCNNGVCALFLFSNTIALRSRRDETSYELFEAFERDVDEVQSEFGRLDHWPYHFATDVRLQHPLFRAGTTSF